MDLYLSISTATQHMRAIVSDSIQLCMHLMQIILFGDICSCRLSSWPRFFISSPLQYCAIYSSIIRKYVTQQYSLFYLILSFSCFIFICSFVCFSFICFVVFCCILLYLFVFSSCYWCCAGLTYFLFLFLFMQVNIATWK